MRVTPRGGRDALGGLVDLSDGRRALKARVSVPPEDGKATAAVMRLIAEALGVPGAQVELVSGATSRLKSFRVSGDPAALDARLTALAAL